MIEIAGIKALVWDFDGTLFDSFVIYESVLAEIAEAHGHTMPSRDHMLNHYHGLLEDSLKGSFGLQSAHEVERAYKLYLDKQTQHYEGDLSERLFNDAISLAEQAASKGLPQLIITNREHKGKNNASPRAIVEATVLADYITEVRSSDEVAFKKPDKRSVADWVERLGIEPSELLVIGDQHVDAELALNLGAPALLVERNGQVPHLNEKHEGVLIVSSLHDVVLV